MALTGGPTLRLDSVIGSRRMIELTGCTIANGDTYASGLKIVTSMDVQPSAGGAHVLGVSTSGGTITFATAGGSETGCFVVIQGF